MRWAPEDGKCLIIGGCNSDKQTYRVEKGTVSVITELTCNHEEADTRIFAHAKWSSKPVLHIVAADTDILSIVLLNFHHFSERKVLLDQSDHSKVIHVNELVDAMNADQDTDLLLLKQRGDIPLSWFFGVIHPLIGSDILCSPRGFGPAWILKACIDYSSYLFDGERGIQVLAQENTLYSDAYAYFILALFKKRYANKIKKKGEELFGASSNIAETLDEVRKDIWVYTLENNTILPSKDCLELRAKNLSFQLKIWLQATNPQIDVPNPCSHGWEEGPEGMQLIPESKENMEKQANVFKTIMRKCKCKKSQCKNGKCVCCVSKSNCSAFCECENCCNPFATEVQKANEESDSGEETEEELEEITENEEPAASDEDIDTDTEY